MAPRTIGEALVARREMLGLDKGRAASRIGMSRTSYGAYERDAQRPSVEVFAPLIDFLQISLEEFLTLYGATCIAIARASFEEPTTESHYSVSVDSTDSAHEDTPGSVDVVADKTFAPDGDGYSDVVVAPREAGAAPEGLDANEGGSPRPSAQSGGSAPSQATFEPPSGMKRDKKHKKRKHKKHR